MSEGFWFVEHTADAKFHAVGKTLDEAFANAALALFETMVDTSLIQPSASVHLELEAEDVDELLYDFLCELLFVFDADGMVFSKFDVSIWHDVGWKLSCECAGEHFEPLRHAPRTEVKAITLHELSVKSTNGGRELTVVLDI